MMNSPPRIQPVCWFFFSGELIGIDCRFNQTGKSVKDIGAEKDGGEDYIAGEEKEPNTFDEGLDEEKTFEDLTMSVVDSFQAM